ncbi:PH domain-containing protein [Lysobacter sp. SG-8]|uniref:PH domain-containing protein n=1 Tax=Marilutibacter penaei TaxID=2759900 RepID=A0A7W3U213_9GAMM|nr:PH domain-containing protein [Lysobacter penaei]MBB1087185.1 PH domain-containing protein [Lysobacter penaei]
MNPGSAPPAIDLRPDWHPLPARARALFALGTVLGFGLPGIGAGVALGVIAGSRGELLSFPAAIAGGIVVVALPLALFGLWLGFKRFRYTAWRLDAHGLAVRQGRLWQRETRVPTTRVQHLDIKRGPLQRRRHLATLVVHTAGTAHSAVAVPHLDADDAEALRDRLGAQIDHDDE